MGAPLAARASRVPGSVRSLIRTCALAAALGPSELGAQGPPRIENLELALENGIVVRYGISLPPGYDARSSDRRPLVLALHPGVRARYYGSEFLRQIVEPGLRALDAVIVAPDVPDRSWSTAPAERVVLALVRHVMDAYSVDRARVLVAGFSMGGAGTWYLAGRHPELFTGAVVMAGSPVGADLERFGPPLYLIHSPDDDVVPFAPVEEAYRVLRARGHAVELRVLPGASHGTMPAYVPALRAAGAWMLEQWSVPPGRGG